MSLTSDHVVLGVFAVGTQVASAIVRPQWRVHGAGRRDLLCMLLDVRRESGPDFIRRIGVDLDTASGPLGEAPVVHGVFDVTDPAGGEHLRRALLRDRRLARLARGKLRAEAVVAGDHARADGVPAIPRARLLLPLSEMVREGRLLLGEVRAAGSILRELAAQLKGVGPKPPRADRSGGEEEEGGGEDLARAVAVAVFLPDSYEAAGAGGRVVPVHVY